MGASFCSWCSTLLSPAPAEAKGATLWSYPNTGAPERWGAMRSDFRSCATGREQSPIDLTAPVEAQLGALSTDYRDVPLRIVNEGHTIRVDYGPGSNLRFHDRAYELTQFHFHTPSEHTHDGQRYAMEAHLVHKDATGNLAVLGVFIREGAPNATLDQIWKYMPTIEGPERVIPDESVNAVGLLPDLTSYFTYLGSLTTPPCSEDVRWIVAAQPITALVQQIVKFRRVFGKNARAVQPTNQRLLLEQQTP